MPPAPVDFDLCEIRNIFRYADDAGPESRRPSPARLPSPTSSRPRPPQPSRRRRLGSWDSSAGGDRLVAALAVDGEVVLLAEGQSAAGFTVLGIDRGGRPPPRTRRARRAALWLPGNGGRAVDRCLGTGARVRPTSWLDPMALKEKFGKLVLLEKLNEGPLGATFRAARVELVRPRPDRDPGAVLGGDLQPTRRRRPASWTRREPPSRLQVPGLVRVLGIGRVEQSYYCSYELVEGRPLRAVIDRAREERFPFAAENALMVASRAAAVLESPPRPQGRGGPAARMHGLVRPRSSSSPGRGTCELTGFGAWPSLRDTGLLGDAGRALPRARSRSRASRGTRDRTSTRSPWCSSRRSPGRRARRLRPPRGGCALARSVSITGEEEPLPDPLEELLRRALATQTRPRATRRWGRCARPSTPCSSPATSPRRRSTSPTSCRRCSARRWSARPRPSKRRVRRTTPSSCPRRPRTPRAGGEADRGRPGRTPAPGRHLGDPAPVGTRVAFAAPERGPEARHLGPSRPGVAPAPG